MWQIRYRSAHKLERMRSILFFRRQDKTAQPIAPLTALGWGRPQLGTAIGLELARFVPGLFRADLLLNVPVFDDLSAAQAE